MAQIKTNLQYGTTGTVQTANIHADAINDTKIADDIIGTEHFTAGEVDQTAIANQAINEAKMQISNAPTNGYMLTAQSGNTGGMTWAEAGGGKIGQVVQTVKTDVFSTTSSSFVDVTGLTVNITPSATSSKILVNVNLSIHSSDNAISGQLFRDSTQIALGDASSNRARSFGSGAYGGTIGNTILLYPNTSFLDSPNTSSQVTYKVKGAAVGGGTLYYGRTHDDTDNSQFARTIQSITVMEVLA